MALYKGGLKVCPIVPKWRGFWSVKIYGFKGTVIDCGTIKTIGDDGYVVFKFAEEGTYTFIAMYGSETKIKEMTLDDSSYFFELKMYIGLRILEYIESTGIQYINTGYKYMNEKTKTYVEFSYTNNTSSQRNLLGCSINDTQYITGFISGNALTFYIGNGSKTGMAVNRSDTSKHIVEIYTPSSVGEKGYVKIDTSTIEYTKNLSNISGANMGIVTQIDKNQTGLANSRCGSFKIYRFKMWDNEVLVRDFIPIITEDDTVCMYDDVEGQIYYNAGAGNFTPGPIKE